MSPSSTEVFLNWRDPVDVHIGARIKALRVNNGYPVSKLADVLGVGLQQIGRYETGSQRITASALYQLAVFLGVSIETFFVGLPMGKPGRRRGGMTISQASVRDARWELEVTLGPTTIELTRTYPDKSRVSLSLPRTRAFEGLGEAAARSLALRLGRRLLAIASDDFASDDVDSGC